MGSTARMEREAKAKKERQMLREKAPVITVLTDEMKELAGLNTVTKMDFSSGTSGLKTEKKKARGKNWWDM